MTDSGNVEHVYARLDEPIDLSEFEVVFCDSKNALAQAYESGLPLHATIRTSAPALLCGTAHNIEPAEQRISGPTLESFQRSILPFATRLFEQTKSCSGVEEFALTVAREGINFHRYLYKAACLEQADFLEPRAVLFDKTLVPPIWPDLLKFNSAFRSFSFARAEVPAVSGLAPSRIRRWRLQGREYLGFRLFKLLWAHLPSTLACSTALILNENELLRETAYHLALRGTRLLRLRPPVIFPQSLEPALRRSIENALLPALDEHLRRWVAEEGLLVCRRLFLDQVTDAVARQIAAHKAWKEVLGSFNGASRLLVLSSYPGQPEHVALGNVCREHRIPMVAFQHGVNREIRATHSKAFMENSVADTLVAYNRVAARVSDESPFSVGVSIVAGVSQQQYRTDRRANRPLPQVFYVSTNLYRGNINLLSGFETDWESAQWELDIIERVFSKLPHKVLYKPYPAVPARYPDPDPVLERARAADNIVVFEEATDLRYLLGSARVIVTSGATSTISWCLLSGKPVVYIDRPAHSPLTPEARAAFKPSVFFFDGSSATFAAKLHELLSIPISEIERRWATMAEPRAAMIDEFVSTGGGGGAKRAARAIRNIMRGGAGRCEGKVP